MSKSKAPLAEGVMNPEAAEHGREERDSIVVRFAGDSGDGMQTVGDQFSDSSVLAGYDISTFPDYPAEIRAPAGTLPGISGFQVHFGKEDVYTPGDRPDALIAMNPAAFKMNLEELTPRGLLVVNTGAFTPDNLKKAGYEDSPLNDPDLATRYTLITLDITKLTMDALADSDLRSADKARCKNFFALGLTFFVYGRSMESTLNWIQKKWGGKPAVAEAASKVLKSGYYFGETAEIGIPQYTVSRTAIEPGVYRKVTGNDALILGLIAATECSYRDMVFGSYPITPASPILEGLAELKNFRVKTVQAEDEIAAIGVAIGASYAGSLGVTATSGPGMCLKAEFLGLAVMAELPLVVVNVQRGGPSTGLPTKTEQADLLQSMYGRNGESPVPIVAASTPADCFHAAIEAVRIALHYCTPVILLTDAYIANGSEPWRVPSVKGLPSLVGDDPIQPGDEYVVYKRDPETLARRHVAPGHRGFEHQLGGLEKNERGLVSYDPANHEHMTLMREEKVARIARSYPPLKVFGPESGKLLVLGWGGTRGAIMAATSRLREKGESVSACIVRHPYPLPLDLEAIIKRFDKVLIPELNRGQFAMMIRAKYLVDAISYSKVQGRPFTIVEIEEAVMKILHEENASV